MSGEMIKITAGGNADVEAYLAKPEGKGPWPGIVLLAEVYNVNHWVREVADGYTNTDDSDKVVPFKEILMRSLAANDGRTADDVKRLHGILSE